MIDIAQALGVDAYYLKHGVKTLVANDKTINQVVEMMKQTSKEGRAVVLNKAQEMLQMYSLEIAGKQQKSSA